MRSGWAPVRSKEVLRRRDSVGGLLGRNGALIAIAEGVGEWLAVCRETDVIDCPAVDGDGGNAFGGSFGRLAQSFFKAGKNVVQGPVQRIAAMHGAVWECDELTRCTACRCPAKQRNAAAFRAQIDGDARSVRSEGQIVLWGHRRNASVSPPSTGMMWPVVQCDLGPARKRIASAQSAGSIG